MSKYIFHYIIMGLIGFVVVLVLFIIALASSVYGW